MDTFVLFGAYFKELRQKTGLSLRQFCLNNGLDAGNISKMERGIAPPPSSHKILEKYATFLQIEQDSNEWYEFFDRAAACTGKLPQDVMNDAQLVGKLPLVFRTLRGQKPGNDKFSELAELIRRS